MPFVRELLKNKQCSMDIKSVHPDEVLKTISELSNSAAFGLDNIDTFTIKLIKHEIAPVLTHIINLSIAQRKFPDTWKNSKIIPLYKKDEVMNPKNYRPIAIIPIVSKVMERVVFNQMVKYLTRNSLLPPRHHGFRGGHSTTTALIQMVDSWTQMVDSGQLAGVCMLDMSSAFDMVQHDILLGKMACYGFKEDLLKWLESYLTNRKQTVCINGTLSRLLPVETGVPQGSILGPLLYTLFINELPELVKMNPAEEKRDKTAIWSENFHRGPNICCYADDSTLSCGSSSYSDLSETLTENYNLITKFMINNRLKLNDDKSHLLVITSSEARARSQSANLVVIKTTTEDIKPTHQQKILGCWVEDNLKWIYNIRESEDNLYKTLNKRLSALKLIAKSSSFKQRKMFGCGIFHSKLIYMISVWGHCSKELLESLQVIQNRAGRTITRNWDISNKENFKQIGWLSVKQLIQYHCIVLLHGVKLSESPKYLHSIYDWNYSYQTRQATMGVIKPFGTPQLEITKRSFRWQAFQFYNNLPSDITQVQDIASFKKMTKQWISENVPFQ